MRRLAMRASFALLLVQGCGRREDGAPPATMTPSATSAAAPTAPQRVRSEVPAMPSGSTASIVIVDANPSSVVLDGRRVTPDAMTRALAARVARDGDFELTIVVRSNVPYSRVLDTTDRARSAGITRVGLRETAP